MEKWESGYRPVRARGVWQEFRPVSHGTLGGERPVE